MSLVRAELPADDHAGWVLLLPPPRPTDRLLCLELDAVRVAEGAAFWFDSVTALNLPAQTEVKFVRGSPPRESPLAWNASALPCEPASYSIVVCRFAGSDAGAAALATWLPQIAQVLEPGGCVYLDVDNSASWRRRPRSGGCRRGELQAELARAGFVQQRFHAQVFENGQLSEVIAPAGYVAARNAWRLRERLKEMLLGRFTQRWFAPVHAVLASRTPLGGSALQDLPAMRAAPDAGFSQFLVNAGKCFVAGGKDSQQIPTITVVPTRGDTITRRRTELAAIGQLTSARLPVAGLLPRVAREVDHGRHPVFEYEAFAGTTIDLPTRGFDQCLERAARVLCDFNRGSLDRRALDDEEFARLVERPLALASQRYPAGAAAAARLSGALAIALRGRVLPLVWQHGDYKLENLVFDTGDRRVRAIIDWELASPCGLALVDLWYLLAYAEITRGAADDILPVMRDVMLVERWRPASRRLLEQYVAEFPEVTPFKNVAFGLFLAHHVANRFAYDARDLGRQELIAQLMQDITARLESTPELRP